ncbi:hypothetical protein KZ856_34105, partial [Pseudomonas aeruginosa]|nr:hypothetical protein [Pseudomonas aeruginosa]
MPWVIVEQQPQRGSVAQPPAQLRFVAVLGQAEGAGQAAAEGRGVQRFPCLLYTSPSPRDGATSR